MGNCRKRSNGESNFKGNDSLHITSNEKLVNETQNENYATIHTEMKIVDSQNYKANSPETKKPLLQSKEPEKQQVSNADDSKKNYPVDEENKVIINEQAQHHLINVEKEQREEHTKKVPPLAYQNLIDTSIPHENNQHLINIPDKSQTSILVDEKNAKITQDYVFLNPPLGAFGTVLKAIHKKAGLCKAIKIINKGTTSKEEQDKLLNKLEILKELDHPYISKIFEFYQDERYFYIVTDICLGGELFDKIIEEKHFSEQKAAEIMQQVISAIYYCHAHNIVHCDLKPENLLFDSNKKDSLLKVIGFGTSKVFDSTNKMNRRFGTAYYIAPEVLRKKYDEKCDIWSCGVILYILLCGYPPFNGCNDRAIMEKVAKGTFSFDGEEWQQISHEAKSFIRKMLEYNPANRLSAEQCLHDPWLKKYARNDVGEIPILTKALENMRVFRAETKLQEAIWVFLVNYLAIKDKKAQLLKTFHALDTNGDGQLIREELINGFRQTMNEVQADMEVNKIMQTVDKNNSGAIDYTEFVIATCNRENLISKQRLEMAFQMFDKDGSSSLSIAELKDIIGGDTIYNDIWKEIAKEVDDNEDAEITYKEFKEIMMKLIH